MIKLEHDTVSEILDSLEALTCHARMHGKTLNLDSIGRRKVDSDIARAKGLREKLREYFDSGRTTELENEALVKCKDDLSNALEWGTDIANENIRLKKLQQLRDGE